AAVSQAGAMGVVQPVSLTYVFGYDFRQGLKYIRSLTDKPIGMNALIEGNNKRYHQRMAEWIDIALEEGVRFFITSLGKPNWVVDQVQAQQGIVYHDVTEAKWAEKALQAGVDGLIAVNNRAGGHAGQLTATALIQDLKQFEVPVICAGGIASASSYAEVMDLGYAGVQMGTRFIASKECSASDDYKQAIIEASEQDIVLSEKVTGVPVSMINTDTVKRMGVKTGWLEKQLSQFNRLKHWLRVIRVLRSYKRLQQASSGLSQKDHFWQAGKSVAEIDCVLPVTEIIHRLVKA
ncbi:MAG: nitronate monooxygenase, partial [Gammaproteobacteria bacterium]|nr:nitronate monooxygenase [Gammaproteobacteria bacterium]